MCQDGIIYRNAKSTNWVVVVYARIVNVDRALLVARRMQCEGICMTFVTNEKILETCCYVACLERALALKPIGTCVSPSLMIGETGDY